MTRAEQAGEIMEYPAFMEYYRRTHKQPLALEWLMDNDVDRIYNKEFLPWLVKNKKATTTGRSRRKTRRRGREAAERQLLTGLREAEALLTIGATVTAKQLLSNMGVDLSALS